MPDIEESAVAVKAGAGLILGDGGYNGPFPGSTTNLVGAEVTRDFNKGKLALVYYHGSSEDSFSQDDLPIPDALKDLFHFNQTRKASLHFGLAEWRWNEVPLFSMGRWTLIKPEVGFGVGAFHISTEFGGDTTRQMGAWKFVGTGSISLDLVKYGPLSLNTGVRMFAGQSFGMMSEVSLKAIVN